MLSKNQIKTLTALHQKKYRRETGNFIAEGDKIVRDLLNSDFKIEEIYLTDFKYAEFRFLLKDHRYTIVDEEDLKKISTLASPQQILAVVQMPEEATEINYAGGLKLVLSEIKDPGNMGTLLRIADWFGIEEVICSHETVECSNPKVIQSSMGSLFRVKISYADLVDVFQNNLKNNSLPVYGTLLDGENIFSKKLLSSGFILLGNESEGLSADIKKFITDPLQIPGFATGATKPDSLNVAVAGGIVCAEFKRQVG